MRFFYKTYHILLVFFGFLLLLLSCNIKDDSETNKKEYSGKPQIEFYNVSHDFGNLKEGEIVECTFRYKNTGDAPLSLLYVEADCGCTVPEYSKGGILPGEEGKIKAVFDSNGFRNNIYKTIDVETNADSSITELVLTAFIERTQNY